MDEMIGIDTLNLDQECALYSDQYVIIADEYAMALDEREDKEEGMKEMFSKLFVSISEALAEQLGKKPSDKVVEHHVRGSKVYQEVVTEYLDAKLGAHLLLNRVTGMKSKKDMLEEIVKLLLSEHYSEVSTKVMTEHSKAVSAETSKLKASTKPRRFRK